MNKHILIADDNAENRELLAACLEPKGYQVSFATDGQEALTGATQADPLPDLVLLDVMMPRLSGFEACEQIKAQRNVPILLVTALNEPGDHERGQSAGADGFLPKPIKRNILLEAVEKLLQNSQ